MPRYCAAYGCNNSDSDPSLKNVTFHCFPLKNETLLKLWLIRIRREDFTPTPSSKICSEHFTDADFHFENFTGRRIINRDAVPSIFSFNKLSKRKRSKSSKRITCQSPDITSSNEIKNEEMPEISEVPEISEMPEISEVQEVEEDAIQTESNVIATLLAINKKLESELADLKRKYKPKVKEVAIQTESDVIATLLAINTKLESELADLKRKYQQVVFQCESITDDSVMNTLTGLSINTFNSVFDYLCLETALSREGSLSPRNQFFMLCVYLRTGITQNCLGYLTGVTQTTMSRFIANTSHALYAKLKTLDMWPTREYVQSKGPQSFFTIYPNCRVIVDCVEVQIQLPTDLALQENTFNAYKDMYTLKALLGITPSGEISFISEFFGGAISDKELFLKSGILNLLQPGDLVLADRGFAIQKELENRDCKLAMSHQFPDKIHVTSDGIIANRTNSQHQCLMEQTIFKIKMYKYFNGHIANNCLNIINEYFFITAFFINFANPSINFNFVK